MNKKITRRIWFFTTLIIGMGLIALYSASFENARVSQKVFYDQVGCAVFGMLIMYGLSRVDCRIFYDWAYIFYGFNLVLLIWVLAGGYLALGAQRWITIGGIRFQPSEIAKVSLIFMLARYYSHKPLRLSFNWFNKIQNLMRDLLIPLFWTVLMMFLIFKQPDLGTSLLFMGIFISIIFVSGVEYKIIGGFLGFCALMVPFGWHFLKSYQKDRLLVFLNPNIDPLGAGYTIIQSKIAIGSGQITGKGWLSGTQNQLNFLPERHTDFIFSVIGEEWGFIGALFFIYCFWMLMMACLEVSEKVKDRFGQFVGVGVVTIMTLQVIINIGMVTGLFPVVGLTLPFVSYGRTSFVVTALMMGFILNLSRKRTVF